MARGRDMALWTGVVMAVELVMAPSVAMEAGGPIVYMRVWERFVVLSQCKVRRFGGVWVIRDVEIGWEHGALCPKVI